MIAGALSRDEARVFAARWLPMWSGNRPAELASFYADDAFYSDPAVPDGIEGREALLAYFRRLLARFPDWQWRQTGATPLEGGFLNHWEATVPISGRDTAVRCVGVCTVELRDGLITRNRVYFDRTELLAALAATSDG